MCPPASPTSQPRKPTLITKDNNASTNNPVRRASFGVGCWDFGVRCQPSSTLSVSQYVALLARGLEAVSSLNNLQIGPKLDPRVDSDTTIASADATGTDDGSPVFSHGIILGLKFDLYVPFRIQNDLARDGTQSGTKTEHFRVHIRHAYHSPVVFVELLEADEPPRPSAAMVVLRKYLEKECQNSPHGLAFEFLGPTPFHANFHVAASPVPDRRDRTFETIDVDAPGYADITFSYCTPSFDTTEEAVEALFDELMDELGLYYGVEKRDSEQYTSWSQIENLMSRLVSQPERAGWLERIRRAHKRSRDLEELSIALMQFEVDRIMIESYIKQSLRDVYKRDAQALLKAYVEAEIEGRPVFPTGPVAEFLTFMESRRSKTLELLVLLSAAVIGGVTGSLITTLARQ